MGGAAVSSNTLEPGALGIFPGLPLSYPCRRFRRTESKKPRDYTMDGMIGLEMLSTTMLVKSYREKTSTLILQRACNPPQDKKDK